MFTSLGDKLNGELVDLYPGNYKVQVEIKGNFLFPDTYYLKVISHYRNNSNIEEHDDVVKFTIIDTGSAMFPYGSSANQVTCVLGGTTWNILSKD